jgi:hypothetical protein
MTGVSPDWRAAWTAALDELEVDVVRIENMLADEHRDRDNPLPDPWTPPEGLGSLPLDLRPRADAILTRQLTAAREIAQALTSNRRQAAMAARIEVGDEGAARPAYVDCAM